MHSGGLFRGQSRAVPQWGYAAVPTKYSAASFALVTLGRTAVSMADTARCHKDIGLFCWPDVEVIAGTKAMKHGSVAETV